MIKGDSIYQVLLKHDFDLFCDKKTISGYMEHHLESYYSQIITAINEENGFLGGDFIEQLKLEITTLDHICNEIPVILKSFENGYIKESYEKSEKLFERIKKYYLLGYSWSDDGGNFYRIRSGDFRIRPDSDSKKQKAELFHIKKDLKSRIGAYRYSIAGFPCLYLASDMELAWFECGMPKQFSYCRMVIEESEEALKLIDLSHRPIEFISAVNTLILNERRQKNRKDKLQIYYDLLVKYIITYPIAAACSVKVKDRGCKFVEEYIFPQLFMHWIRESDEFDGVRYKSSLNSSLVKGMGAVNVALPAKKFREDGLDEKLTTKIGVSDIGYFDVNKDFKRYEKALQELNDFKNQLRIYGIESQYAGEYIFDIMDMCECIIKTYNALIEGRYDNSELIFNHLDRLCDHVDLMYSNKENIIDNCIKKVPTTHEQYVEKDLMISHFEEFYKLARKIITKNTVFSFRFKNMNNIEHI